MSLAKQLNKHHRLQPWLAIGVLLFVVASQIAAIQHHHAIDDGSSETLVECDFCLQAGSADGADTSSGMVPTATLHAATRQIPLAAPPIEQLLDINARAPPLHHV
jgi:hypothetical protein